MKKSFDTLKEGPLSFANIRVFDRNPHILALKKELWTECTKEKILPDGRHTTVRQELNLCINEIQEALSKSEPTEIDPCTMGRDNNYDWHGRYRKAKETFYESPYGND